MRIALYQPDIPQNTGTILRLGACLGLPVDVIGPCGFHLDDRRLRRAGLDYLSAATLLRHDSWEVFQGQAEGRLVLLTTQAALPYTQFQFRRDDILLFGGESKGVPSAVHTAADARIVIPLRRGQRSLNVAMATAMVAGEALRQTSGFETTDAPDSQEFQ